MSRLELRPAASLDRAALAELFTAGYEGYWFPVAFDARAFELMVETMDVDLSLSRLAIDDGEPVAVALVARRGAEGWIGGMGVVASHRRRGIGETTLVAALDAARAGGIERVGLEVLEQNLPARALYERLAFAHVRDLDVWSLAGSPDDEPVPGTVDVDEALAWIAARRPAAEPWQRADGTVAQLRRLGEPLEVVAIDDARGSVRAAAVVWRRRGNALIQQASFDDSEAVDDLLQAIGAGAERVLWVNLPSDDPARPRLVAAAGEPAARQQELTLRL